MELQEREMCMKEYIEKRIEKLKVEKNYYLEKLDYNERNESARSKYFEILAVIDELEVLQRMMENE